MVRQGNNAEISWTMNVEYSCGLCPDGMVGDGIQCSQTDPCESNPCYPGATCTMIINSVNYQDSYLDGAYFQNLGNFIP